ncbi:tetratricopeptide repeat protein [Chloroflexota bacterium]
MAYQEEDRTKLKRKSNKEAILLAMQGRWREAIVANESLLESFPNDVDIYNRLGRAYMELEEYSRAKQSYQKTLELDPYNTIAQKNLNRLSHLGEGAVSSGGTFYAVEPQQFIEEVGKTGVVNLYRLAPPGILAKTVAGSKVNLRIEGSSLIAENVRGEYLGRIETKHGQRIIKLMQGGNKYTATIISATEEAVTVIIREVYQDPSQAGRLSFPPRGVEPARQYISDRIIRRELEHEESLSSETTYTVVGGDNDGEILTEASDDMDDEDDIEE